MRGFIRQFVTFVYIKTSAEKYAETDQSVLIIIQNFDKHCVNLDSNHHLITSQRTNILHSLVLKNCSNNPILMF